MDVELPDGRVVQGVPDGMGQLQVADKLRRNGINVPDEWLKTGAPPKASLSAPNQFTEAGRAQADTDFAAQKEKDLAQMKEFGTHAVKSAEGAVGAIGDLIQHPIESVKKVASGIPGAVDKAVQAVAHPRDTLYKAADYVAGLTPGKVGDIVGQAAVGGAAGKALSAVGELAAPAIKAALPEAAVRDVADIAKRANQAGYVLKPSDVGTQGGKIAEGLAGSPKLAVQASVKNQVVTNRLAAEEIGVPGKITKASILEAKKPHNSVYKEVGELGENATDPQYGQDIGAIGRRPGKSFSKARTNEVEELKSQYMESQFDAHDATLEVRALRRKSRLNIKNLDPVKQELGYAQRKVANAIDDQMGRWAELHGKPGLSERFNDARMNLAKIHDVETALIGNTGDVSAKIMSKLQEKGARLSGNLSLIADVADEYGDVMRPGPSLKNKVPVTVLEGVGGIGAAAALGPKGLAVLAARPATRAYLLSKRFQNKMVRGAAKKAASGGIPIAQPASIAALELQDQKRLETPTLRDMEIAR